MTAIFWSTLSLSAAGLVFRAVACGLALDIPRRGFDPVGGGDEEAWNTLGRATHTNIWKPQVATSGKTGVSI